MHIYIYTHVTHAYVSVYTGFCVHTDLDIDTDKDIDIDSGMHMYKQDRRGICRSPPSKRSRIVRSSSLLWFRALGYRHRVLGF